MAGDTAEELERFRQQWQQEVTQRVKGAPSASVTTSPRPPSQSISEATLPPPLIRWETRETEEHAEDLGGEGYHDLEDKDEKRRLGEAGERIHPSITQEPRSALDHYELAVERESEGSLGDSLNHYRKAYRVRIQILVFRRIADVNQARCGRGQYLQEQAFPTFFLQVETDQP